MVVKAPAFTEPGLRDVEVFDASGARQSVLLPDIIMYNEEKDHEAELLDSFLREVPSL